MSDTKHTKLMIIGSEPNGKNINLECGAMFPDQMAEKTKLQHADLGIALDGDADRVVFSDEEGKIIHGDHIIAVLAREMKLSKQLFQNEVIGTSMSNLGLEIFLKSINIKKRKLWDDGFGWIGFRLVRPNFNDGYPLSSKNMGLVKKLLIIAAAMLLIATMPLPIEFYTLLRIVVFGAAAYSAYCFFENKNSQAGLILVLIAIVWNPLIPIYLYDKYIWILLDISAAIYMFLLSRKV